MDGIELNEKFVYFAAAEMEEYERVDRYGWLETTAEDGCYARLRSFGEVKNFVKNTLDLWPRYSGRILAWDVNGDWVVAHRYELGKLVDDNALPAGKHWPWLAMEYIYY